jgi:hypothetical protein
MRDRLMIGSSVESFAATTGSAADHVRIRYDIAFGIDDHSEPIFCCMPASAVLFLPLDSTGPYPVAIIWTTLGVTWLTSFLTALLN